MGEERVDDDEAGHGQRQEPKPGHRPAEEGGQQRQPRHRSGPKDRRLEPGHRAEHDQDGQAAGQPPDEPAAPQQWCGEREGQRQVLAGNHEEVREAGGPEVGRHPGRQIAVVADQEAGDQGPVGVAEPGTPGQHPVANGVGRPHQCRLGPARADEVVGLERGSGVAPAPLRFAGGKRAEAAGEYCRLPRLQQPHPFRRGALRHHEHCAGYGLEPGRDPDARPLTLGVGRQAHRDPPVDATGGEPGRQPVEPGQRPGHRHRPQRGQTDHGADPPH